MTGVSSGALAHPGTHRWAERGGITRNLSLVPIGTVDSAEPHLSAGPDAHPRQRREETHLLAHRLAHRGVSE